MCIFYFQNIHLIYFKIIKYIERNKILYLFNFNIYNILNKSINKLKIKYN